MLVLIIFLCYNYIMLKNARNNMINIKKMQKERQAVKLWLK